MMRGIGCVKRLGAELQLESFGQSEIAVQSKVQVRDSGSVETVVPAIAQRSILGHGKGGFVVVLKQVADPLRRPEAVGSLLVGSDGVKRPGGGSWSKRLAGVCADNAAQLPSTGDLS